MSEKKSSGNDTQVFPQPACLSSDGETFLDGVPGISFRDLCALVAMHGYLSGDYKDFKGVGVAAWAYAVADEMVMEKEKDVQDKDP